MNNVILPMEMLDELWIRLGEIPVDDEDCTDEPFMYWPAGTVREVIWAWFEDSNPEFSVAEKMYAKPEQKAEGEEERDQLLEICEGAAAAIFTSINSENYYEDGYLVLSERPEGYEDDYPDDFCPWKPFEHESPDELLAIIDDEANFIYAVFNKTLETIETQLKDKGVNLKGLKLKNLAVRETLIY